MRKLCFLLLLAFLTNSTLAQDISVAEKYEYVFLRSNVQLFEPRSLEIIYSDGRVEKIGNLSASDLGKNYNKNLSALLKAFDHLGSRGFELVAHPDGKKSLLDVEAEFIFRRKY